MNDIVTVERRNAVAIVTLNFPEKRNALGTAMSAGLSRVLGELQEDEDLRAIVLYGGDHFCVGGDLQREAEVRIV